MRISIMGLGYVGAVSAGCLARDGHSLIGVDPAQAKVDLINSGNSPVVEKDLDELIHTAVGEGRLRATSSTAEAIAQSDLSMICVGTPSQANGSLDLRYVEKVCRDIGESLRHKDDFHVVVARSTMLPGTMESIVIPAIEAHSGKTAGEGFGVCNNPEFLREGTAVYDYSHPPKTVIGETDARSGDIVAALYARLDAPFVRTDVNTAEMVKYADNVWHALKVGFANEIGNICKAVALDSHRVMEIFCQDTKLNLSPYYLKPGFAFGGSCLPKDVRALSYKARALDLDLPILNAIMPSNERQIERAVRLVTGFGKKRIGVLGFSFKAGTDDLRESPVVELIERLIGKGYALRLFDDNVKLASLSGANRDYILNHIPHISRLMVPGVREVVDFADVVIVGTGAPEFRAVPAMLREEQTLIDLVRIGPERPASAAAYEGVCW